MQNHSPLRDILRKKENLVICFFNFLGNGITFIFYEAISSNFLLRRINRKIVGLTYGGHIQDRLEQLDSRMNMYTVQDRTIRQTDRQAADKQTVVYCRLFRTEQLNLF